jgi:hypothetical protein
VGNGFEIRFSTIIARTGARTIALYPEKDTEAFYCRKLVHELKETT